MESKDDPTIVSETASTPLSYAAEVQAELGGPELPRLGRKLCLGIAGWLQYEFHCHHAHLFSEKYLSVPVGNLLSSYYPTSVYAEFKHPILSTLSEGGVGRRPEIDFVVCNNFPHIDVAVETKWCGKTKPSIPSIMWDLMRLEMLASEFQTNAFFVLAGQKKKLDALFRSKGFQGAKPRPLLAIKGGRRKRFNIPTLP